MKDRPAREVRPERETAPEGATTAPTSWSSRVLGLQATAGNAAVCAALARRPAAPGSGAPVIRRTMQDAAAYNHANSLGIASQGAGIGVLARADVLAYVTTPGNPAHHRAALLAEWNKGTSPRLQICLLYTSPSPRAGLLSRMPSSA